MIIVIIPFADLKYHSYTKNISKVYPVINNRMINPFQYILVARSLIVLNAKKPHLIWYNHFYMAFPY